MYFDNILAFDSACTTCSACVSVKGKVVSSFYADNGLTHSQTLLPAIERVLNESGLSMSQIGAIAITSGPGSFTGLKIGAATAKGLSFPRNIPCVSLSTLCALSYAFADKDGIICPVLDARRGMFYNAVFRSHGGKVERLTGDRQIPAENLRDELSGKFPGEKIYINGDGSNLFAETLSYSGILFEKAEPFGCKAEYIIAAALSGDGKECTAAELVPEYLRIPQAEREKFKS